MPWKRKKSATRRYISICKLNVPSCDNNHIHSTCFPTKNMIFSHLENEFQDSASEIKTSDNKKFQIWSYDLLVEKKRKILIHCKSWKEYQRFHDCVFWAWVKLLSTVKPETRLYNIWDGIEILNKDAVIIISGTNDVDSLSPFQLAVYRALHKIDKSLCRVIKKVIM